MNSNMISAAGSSNAGSRGKLVQGADRSRLRISDCRLTSRGLFGEMYASNNLYYNIRKEYRGSYLGILEDKGALKYLFKSR